eukprot:Blabericola_migrator_1__6304@NODE_3181_length_1972_cov_84_833596_g1989_i0_p1_GENE_NODE_3181_length_1972_cov_84_833596_g1989_i0NODE_3181_length_1972_cov_84_833596_g1989_i0_p1_ORF_typecomplete_len363_score34_24_NODE_3181_length_1972_cov_84_833596_g1989_i07741862
MEISEVQESKADEEELSNSTESGTPDAETESTEAQTQGEESTHLPYEAVTMATFILPFLHALDRYRMAQTCRALRSRIYVLEWEREAMFEYMYMMPLGTVSMTTHCRPFLHQDVIGSTVLASRRLRLRLAIRTWHLACARLFATNFGSRVTVNSQQPNFGALCNTTYALSGGQTLRPVFVNEILGWDQVGELIYDMMDADRRGTLLSHIGLLRLNPLLLKELLTPSEMDEWWINKRSIFGTSLGHATAGVVNDLADFVETRDIRALFTLDNMVLTDEPVGNPVSLRAVSIAWLSDLCRRCLKPALSSEGFRPWIDSVDGVDETGGYGTFFGIVPLVFRSGIEFCGTNSTVQVSIPTSFEGYS